MPESRRGVPAPKGTLVVVECDLYNASGWMAVDTRPFNDDGEFSSAGSSVRRFRAAALSDAGGRWPILWSDRAGKATARTT